MFPKRRAPQTPSPAGQAGAGRPPASQPPAGGMPTQQPLTPAPGAAYPGAQPGVDPAGGEMQEMWNAMAALLDNTTVRADGSSAEASVPLHAPDDAHAWDAAANVWGAATPAESAETTQPEPVNSALFATAPPAPAASEAEAPPAEEAAAATFKAKPLAQPNIAPASSAPAAPPAPSEQAPAHSPAQHPAQGNDPARWAPPPLAPPGSRPSAPTLQPQPVQPQPVQHMTETTEEAKVAPDDAPWGAPPLIAPETLNPETRAPENVMIGPQLQPAPDDALWGAQQPAPQPQPVTRAPLLLRAPGSPFTLAAGLDQNAVILRGRSDGIAIEIASGQWEDLLHLLSYRLEQTDGFFAGGYIAVDLGTRQLNEAELDLLGRVLAAYTMQPGLVRTAEDRTFQAALALGIPCVQIALDGSVINEAMPAQADDKSFPFFVYRGSLRSGQQLYRHEHIMIMGDVNPGAHVASNGDILIWGRLRGIAHAGAQGNTGAIIAALDLDPVQLRIDTVVAAGQPEQAKPSTATGPRWGAARTSDRRPEIARLVNGRLLIEAWDNIKTAGAPLLKRRRA